MTADESGHPMPEVTARSVADAAPILDEAATGPVYVVARALAGRMHRRVFLSAEAAERLRAKLAGQGVASRVIVAQMSAHGLPAAAQPSPEAAQPAAPLQARSYTEADVHEDARSLLLSVLRGDPEAAEWVAANSADPRALALKLGRFGAYALADFLRHAGATKLLEEWDR